MMASIRLIPARIAGLFFKRRIDREIEEELAFHLRMRAQENVDRGQSSEEAQQNARRAFGNLEVIKEASRDVRGGGLIESCWRDFRFGWRIVKKQPRSAALISIVLAIGIGSSTAILSHITQMLYKPAPYHAPERLVRLTAKHRDASRLPIAPETLKYLARNNTTLSDIAEFQFERIVADDGHGPREVQAEAVSENFFKVLGLPLAFGRDFQAEDNDLTNPVVCIITDSFWHYFLDTDPHAIGRTISVNKKPALIVGILASNDRIIDDVFLPIHREDNLVCNRKSDQGPFAVARLKPGVSLKQARSEIDKLQKRSFGVSYKSDRIIMHSLRRDAIGPHETGLLIILASAGILLTVTCANVSNLLLVRGARRLDEFIIRMAFGAGRVRIVRQLISESFSLIAIGACLGLVIAISILILLHWNSFIRYQLITTVTTHTSVDWRIFLGTCFVASVIIAVFAIVSGVPISNRALPDGLRITGQGITPVANQKMRSALVVFQIAISTILLFSAVNALQGLRNSITRDPQLTSLFEVELPFVFDHHGDPVPFIEKLMTRVRSVPGIDSASYSSGGPTDNIICTYQVTDPAISTSRINHSIVSFVDPKYFETVGARLITGRAFGAETTEAPQSAVIVDETLAKREFPDRSPIGQRLTITLANKQFEAEIIGVSPHLNFYGIDDTEWVRSQIYLPLREIPSGLVPTVLSQGKLLLTTNKQPEEWSPIILPSGDGPIGSVCKIVQDLDPHQSFSYAKSIELLITISTAPKYLSLYVLVTFAGFSILLAIVSIRSLVAYTIDQRSHEIAIRLALGVRISQLYKLVGKEAIRLLLLGLIIGACLTLLLIQFVFRYQGNETFDAVNSVLVFLLFAGVALASCYASVRKATLIDPNRLLRAE